MQIRIVHHSIKDPVATFVITEETTLEIIKKFYLMQSKLLLSEFKFVIHDEITYSGLLIDDSDSTLLNLPFITFVADKHLSAVTLYVMTSREEFLVLNQKAPKTFSASPAPAEANGISSEDESAMHTPTEALSPCSPCSPCSGPKSIIKFQYPASNILSADEEQKPKEFLPLKLPPTFVPDLYAAEKKALASGRMFL